MSEKSTALKELSACTTTLRNLAIHHKYCVRRKVETKDEALNTFRHETYVILLVLEQICDADILGAYRREYKRLKEEISALVDEI